MLIRIARQVPTWRTALLTLLLATSFLPIPGTAEARDTVLRMGWDSKAPYHYIEQKGQTEYLTGLDVELVRLIAGDAGFRIDFEEVDWASNLENVRSGESDVALGAFYDEDRASYAWFSDPYRVEKQVLFLDRSSMPQFAPASVQDFLEQLKGQSFHLGIVDDYFYGTEATAILHSEEYASFVSMARSEGLLLNLLVNDEIDGFISDRLVGAKAISQLGLSERLQEYPLVLYEANVHAMFSRATSSFDDVEQFNRSLADLKASGVYETVLRRYTAPILLSIAVSGNWFFILDIIETIAFAISGVLIARKESYSLLGAFVLASLPAVGGGVVRDLLVGREPIGIVETPLYVFLVVGTVATGYIVNWILKYVRGRFLIVFDISVWIVNMSRYVLPRNVFEVFDAIGLASFTVTGVAIASNYGAEPLWVWGPLLAAITAGGGGILRDVFRADANNPDWRQLEFPATTNRNPRFFRADPDHEDMVKDQQVRRLVKLRKNEKTLTMAAARAGLSRKTARKYLKSGKLPSQCQPERYWRTRSDPFESVWPEVEEILKRSPTVEATAVFEYLCRQQEGAFQQGQLRTLQRRIKQWKVEHGEAKEVMFPQKYRPGHQAQSDFTFMGRLGVTIQGQPFPHLLYHFVLAYSNWEATTLCFSESFESLSLGLQNALWELGALPEEHRTDRLSAAVNNLKREEFTERYQGLLNHFGMRSSRTQAGKAHENGDVEQAHHRLKRAIEQELLLRCSRDFSSREEYEGFVAVIVARRNAARQKRLGEELAVMRPLPARRLDDFTRQWVKVSPSSTIRVRHNTYSVDSRLIGERVQVRVWADQVEIYYGGRSHSRMPRLRGEGKHRIDYRHVIHSLVRKPGAFLRYRWREDLFPGILFRVAYDELRQDCPATADRQYLKILELAAQEGEQRVREALQGLIERGQNIRFEALRECLVDPVVEPWEVAVEKMDVGLYDTLLESREVRS